MVKELHLNTCIQLHMTKHPFQKVMNFRHLLGCDTIIRKYDTTLMFATLQTREKLKTPSLHL